MGTNLGQGLVPSIDDYLFGIWGLINTPNLLAQIAGQGLVPSMNHHFAWYGWAGFGFDWYSAGIWGSEVGKRNNPGAEERAAELLRFFRKRKLPLFHIQHLSVTPNSPLRPGQPGVKIKKIVEPKRGEIVINKSVNSAFIGTDLKKILEKAEMSLQEMNGPEASRSAIKTVIFAGLTTDHCVSTSVRMAGNFGFRTIVISDATATFDRNFNGKYFSAKTMHEMALASLNGEFAEILTTRELLKLL